MPPRFAGVPVQSAKAYLLGKRNKSHTTVFSPCRTVQNDEISTNQRFGSTGHSRQISTLRSAGRLRSVFRATRTLYYHPGHTKNETLPTRTTPLPAVGSLRSAICLLGQGQGLPGRSGRGSSPESGDNMSSADATVNIRWYGGREVSEPA